MYNWINIILSNPIFSEFLRIAKSIFVGWWWVPLPFILKKPFLFFFLWWKQDIFVSKQKSVFLEIKLPKDIDKPIRAMEVVLSSIHAAIYQPPDKFEKWMEGQVQMAIALEIASIDGEPSFFIRTPAGFREVIETSLYAQYPDLEINEAEDYTKYAPQSIPNKEWDLFGCTYRMNRPDYYPIKTYLEFETEREDSEEKKIDPIAVLLEGFSRIKKGEQIWLQFIVKPIGDADIEKSLSRWKKKGEELKDKLAKRPVKDERTIPVVQEAAEILLFGPKETKKEERELIPPEMKLTVGEREILTAIENKMTKPIFDVTIRFIFMGKRDVWFKPNLRLLFAYFNEYTTNHLNALYPNGRTITKIKKKIFFRLPNIKLIRSRRHYLRCRKLFRNYIRRKSPYFPKPGGTFMLNTEELASLFHFPSKGAAPAPGVTRVETRKRGVPANLPIE